MTIKKPKIEIADAVLIGIAIVALALLLLAFWTSHQTINECGSLPLSAYASPDDTTPAKCYAMWKDGRL